MKNQVDDNLEKYYLGKGYRYVIGIDEVGRGSWAGPVVAGAFVYTASSSYLPRVNDSKLLTKKQRNELSKTLSMEHYAIGQADPSEIDSLNIVEAIRLAFKRALTKLTIDNSMVLIDGYFKDVFPFSHKCIIKGDQKHYSIAAASILAKVYRDKLMGKLAQRYPQYGFDLHVGYGTKKHREALTQYGICEIHRKSYKPIKNLIL